MEFDTSPSSNLREADSIVVPVVRNPVPGPKYLSVLYVKKPQKIHVCNRIVDTSTIDPVTMPTQFINVYLSLEI